MTDILERLSVWDETPKDGDPMIDVLLDDIAAAKAAIIAMRDAQGRPGGSNVPAVAASTTGITDKALIREIAMDIGKSTVAHIETGYPAALEAVSKNARLSIRNHVHNQIVAAIEVVNEEEIRARLDRRKLERRRELALHRRWRNEQRERAE